MKTAAEELDLKDVRLFKLAEVCGQEGLKYVEAVKPSEAKLHF